MSADQFAGFNFRHLRYFLMVCEEGSFRGASARLHVAQSAVSRRVADLEDIFGVRLLERRPRGIALTEAGHALRDSAASIEREARLARETLDRYRQGEEGLLSLAFFGTTARLSFVPDLIAGYRAQNPQIRLGFATFPNGEADETVLAAADVAVFESRPPLSEERADHLLFSGDYMLATPRGHRLADRPIIAFADLYGQELIGIPQSASPRMYDRLVQQAARRGRALSVIHETESECARLAFAAAGMGIALVSPLAINHDQHFDVEYRAIADIDLPFEIWLSVKTQELPAAAAFTEAAEGLFGKVEALRRPI